MLLACLKRENISIAKTKDYADWSYSAGSLDG
jgi:hypothetical protein